MSVKKKQALSAAIHVWQIFLQVPHVDRPASQRRVGVVCVPVSRRGVL